MNHSEIFEAYAKIATAEGLIQDRKETSLEKKLETDKKREYNSRKDYSQFKHMDDKGKDLYNLKPDQIYKYKDNIAESAHKDSLNLIPSYGDNGIVENVNETHEEMLKKIEKHPHGTYLQFVKAENELLTELVRIADYLDIQNEDKLVSLADGCIEVLNKKASESKKNFKKVADSGTTAEIATGATVVLGGIAAAILGIAGSAAAAPVGVAAVSIGVILAIYNNIQLNRGIIKNCSEAISCLQEMLDDHEVGNMQESIVNSIVYLKELIVKFKYHYNTSLKSKSFRDTAFESKNTVDDLLKSDEFKKMTQELVQLSKVIEASKVDLELLKNDLNSLHESKNYYQEEDGFFSKNYWLNKVRDAERLVGTSDAKKSAMAVDEVLSSLNEFLKSVQESVAFGKQEGKKKATEIQGKEKGTVETVIDSAKEKFNEFTGNKNTPDNKNAPDNKNTPQAESKTNKPAPDFSWMDKK